MITSKEMIEKFYGNKIGFWRQCINYIKILKPSKLGGDPGKLQMDKSEAKIIFKNEFEKSFERGHNRSF